jgi:phosphohistidine phosphatase SixA
VDTAKRFSSNVFEAAMITVFLVRHADVDVPPASQDASLNAAGQARARALAHAVGAAGIKAIFTSKLRRTKETVAPLANNLGLQPHEASDMLATDLLGGADGAVVLIAGHSNTVPEMIGALGVTQPLPTIGHRDFDNLFVVTATAAGNAALLRLKYGSAGG